MPNLTWNVNDPANTANFSTTVGVYTRLGNGISLDVYFRKQAERVVAYHVLYESSGGNSELGNGLLRFADDGALQQVIENEKARLPGPNGAEGSIRLHFGTPREQGGSGLDGLTYFDGPSNVSQQTQDGFQAVLGYRCPKALAVDSDHHAAQPIAGLEMCPARATSRVTLRANLGDDSYIAKFLAENATGMSAEFALEFRESSPRTWHYSVSLRGEVTGPELASGRVSFDEQGALTEVQVERQLHFPNLDGSEGAQIELDFGAPRIAEAGGVDGLTAFPMSSFSSSAWKDGHEFRLQACSKLPSEADALVPIEYVFGAPPLCADILSHRLTANGTLHSYSPLVTRDWDPNAAREPGEYCQRIGLVDAALRVVSVELCFRHSAERAWDVRLVSHARQEAVELARAQLSFDEYGIYGRKTGDSSFTLPLLDGSAGPRINLDLGFPADGSVGRGNIWSSWGQSEVRLYTNGMRKAACATAK